MVIFEKNFLKVKIRKNQIFYFSRSSQPNLMKIG